MNLARTLGSVGGLTLASRILALVRDSLQARYVGANFASDAFLVAFRLPNMFRAFFAEGAFSSAFIPMFNRKLAEEGGGRGAAFDFAERSLSMLFAFLAVMTVVMLVAAWPLTALLSGGFHHQHPTHDQFAFAVELSRITIPYLMLICLASLLGGILNSLDKFWVNAAAPILLNIAMVAGLLAFHGTPYESAKVQALSVPIGGLLQLAWLFFACRAAGVSLRPRLPRIDADVKRLMQLILPAAIGAGAVQFNLVVSTALSGYLLGEGSISYIYYADRVNQLPLGMIGIGLGTILLPTISRLLSAGEDEKAMDTQNRGMELALFLTLPGHGRADRRRRADRPRPVPVRPFRCRRHGQMFVGARRILDRPPLLRAREGADPGLLCAARHEDARALRRPVGRREPGGQSDPDPCAEPLRLRARRAAARDRTVVDRERLAPLRDVEETRPFRRRRPVEAPHPEARSRGHPDGRRDLRVRPAARSPGSTGACGSAIRRW